jgi:outer membrane protein assembly factor BamB
MMSRSALAVALVLVPGSALADDWPMFAGRADRNPVSAEKGLVEKWAKNDLSMVKWTAELGKDTYSNPVVAGGRIFIGTNNEKPRDPGLKGDKGILMCFAEKDGAFLWQAVHDKLPGGEKEDFPSIGICSTPCVAGPRVYYVSNRAELVCLDVAGFADGKNDGPVTDEKRSGPQDADVVWRLDFRKELGVRPNQASASSPLVVGNLVFVVTGHGVDGETGKVINPEAPSFVAVDKATGKVVWKDASPGPRLLSGQWGSPAYGVVDGVPQVCYPGGDGWVYAFDPLTGQLLWKLNGKAHETPKPDGKPGTPYHFVASPVYAGHRVLIALGADEDSGTHQGGLRAIDARRRGDLTTSGVLWSVLGEAFSGTISQATVHDGLVYAPELSGNLNCFELETGKRVWQHDLLANVWGSPVVADGRLYLRNGDGEVVTMALGREKKVLGASGLPDLAHGTVTPANGVLYVAGKTKLWALAKPK